MLAIARNNFKNQKSHGAADAALPIGEMQIKVPKAMTNPPIHIQITNGRTSTFKVA